MKIYEKTYTLSNLSPTVTIDILDGQQLYYVRGSGTLTTGWSIGVSDVPTRPTYFKIWYDGNATYSGGNAIAVINRILTQEQAISGKCIIEANYNFITSSWDVAVLEGFDTDYEGLAVVPMNPAGATVMLTSNSKQVQYFTGAAVPLTGNYSVTWSGTFRDGQTFFLKYAGLFTLGTSTINFFGINIGAAQALLGNSTVIAWYDAANATFRTQLIGVPPSGGGGGTGAFATLPVSITGTLYPAANAGDSFRITTPSGIGRLGTNLPVPPNPFLTAPAVRIVYQNDVLYCLVTTAGGDTAAAGSSFYVESASRAMAPLDSTEGTTNYQINATNLNTSLGTINTVGIGTNTRNGFWGYGNSVSNGSVLNWIVGIGNSILGALYNLVTGSSHTLHIGSENNMVAGYFNDVTGDNNVVGGKNNVIAGSETVVAGAFHNGTPVRSMIVGAGTDAKISNSIYLGGATSPGSFGGFGAMQTQVTSLAGAVTAVSHPAVTPLTLAANIFSSTGDYLLLGSNSMLWSFEARIIVAQTAVGADHTNTSAVGDWAEYVVCGVAKRTGGVTTLTETKWLDHRNRWIPATSPNALAYRNRVITGTRADMNLVQPSISINSNIIEISFVFPGFASLMTDQGANATPRYCVKLAAGDFDGGGLIPIGTGAAGCGIVPNTMTTTLAPVTTTVFRNPVVDIFDGSDSDGTGYYGGVGVGATASAIMDATSVASIGFYNYGSYAVGAAPTMTFNGGNAAQGVITMSGANNLHIGNNVVVVTGGTYTAANGSYPVVFAGGFGAGATGTATITAGAITAVSITNGGSGYHNGDVISINCPAGGETVAATFTYTLYESIVSMTIGGVNNNYTNLTDLTTTFPLVGADLAPAIATAQLTPQDLGGAGSITVDTGGQGYGIRTPDVSIFDGGGTLYQDGNGGSFRASGHIIISQLKYA